MSAVSAPHTSLPDGVSQPIPRPVLPLPARHVCVFPDCDKSFTRKEHLSRHARSHTSENQYACTQCSKSFSRRYVRVSLECLLLLSSIASGDAADVYPRRRLSQDSRKTIKVKEKDRMLTCPQRQSCSTSRPSWRCLRTEPIRTKQESLHVMSQPQDQMRRLSAMFNVYQERHRLCL